jgi:hypothetical protein
MTFLKPSSASISSMKALVTLVPLLDLRQQFGPSISTVAGQWLMHGRFWMVACSCSLTVKVAIYWREEVGALRLMVDAKPV